MQYRRFGRTGWQVGEIGYGMWGLAGWTGSEDAESTESLDRAAQTLDVRASRGAERGTVTDPQRHRCNIVFGKQPHRPRGRGDARDQAVSGRG